MRLPLPIRRARKVLKQKIADFKILRVWRVLRQMVASLQARLRRRPFDSDPGRLRVAADLGVGWEGHLIGLAWLKELKQDILIIDVYGEPDTLAFLTAGHDFISGFHDRAGFKKFCGYDVRLVLGQLIDVPYINMAKVSGLSPGLANLFGRIMLFAQRHRKYIDFAPQFNGAWAKMCSKVMGWNQWSALGAQSAFPFSQHSHLPLNPSAAMAQVIVNGAELPKNSYITIHTAAFINGRPLTTQWPVEYWTDFCGLFKTRHPDMAIIQVGFGGEPPIAGADHHILKSGSLGELALILKNAALHIDEDSDLVHLQYVLGGRSLVLFGPTVADYVMYPENINIVSSFCGECMWMLRDWHTQCVLNHKQPECMRHINPESVCQAACRSLAETASVGQAGMSNPRQSPGRSLIAEGKEEKTSCLTF